MANIKEIASRHKVILDINDKSNTFIQSTSNIEKKEGRFRRTWINDNSEATKKETGFKQGLNRVETGFINTVETQLKQGLNCVEDYSETGFKQGLNRVEDLRGNPFKVMQYLTNTTSSKDPYITGRVSVTDIAEHTVLSRESVKTALKFLIKNKMVLRLDSKTGLYGWTSYKLLESFTEDFIKQGLNRVETGGISSSNLNTTTTNTTEKENNKLINIEALRNIGLTYSHVTQILNQQKLTVEMIQDSIDAFAYDLKYNNKASEIKGKPLNYFMGILRSGQVYIPPENYELPDQESMRLYLESKKAQKAQKQKIEKEIFDIHLKEWIDTLTELQIKAIVPQYDSKKGIGLMIHASLIEHFKEREWSKIKPFE